MKSSYKFNNLVYFIGLWILTMALFAGAVFAQNTGAGTINGTLTDPAGSVVPARQWWCAIPTPEPSAHW